MQLLNRPARFKFIQVDKAPGSVHRLPLLFAEAEDVDYGQYAHGIKDENADKPGKVGILSRPPQGNSLFDAKDGEQPGDSLY